MVMEERREKEGMEAGGAGCGWGEGIMWYRCMGRVAVHVVSVQRGHFTVSLR